MMNQANMPTKFSKIAEYLAEKYVRAQELKTAADSEKRQEPEEGFSLVGGVGGGMLGSAGYTGAANAWDRYQLGRNPIHRDTTIAKQHSARLAEQIERLLRADTRRVRNPVLQEALSGVRVAEDQLEKLRKQPDVRAGGRQVVHPSNIGKPIPQTESAAAIQRAEQQWRDASQILEKVKGRPAKRTLSEREIEHLTKLKTDLAGISDSAGLKKLLGDAENLAVSKVTGKKGMPAGGERVFNATTQKMLQKGIKGAYSRLEAAGLPKNLEHYKPYLPGRANPFSVSSLRPFSKIRGGLAGTAITGGALLGGSTLPYWVSKVMNGERKAAEFEETGWKPFGRR